MPIIPRRTLSCSTGALVLSAMLLSLTALCHAMTLREATDSLVRQLWEGNPPGEVLFSEDFEAGNLEAWRADPNWSIVERADPPGKSGQVVSSQTADDIQDLILPENVPVTPGHPIAVCWRARSLDGTSPLHLRVDFFDAEGKTGEPYARQETGAQGPNWTENTVLVSDWFPPYTRAITIWFHQSAQSNTTSLLDDIRVVDLQPAAQEIVARELPRYRELARRLPAQADALAASAINDVWKATVRRTCESIGEQLDAAAALEPGSQAASDAPGRPSRYPKAPSGADRSPAGLGDQSRLEGDGTPHLRVHGGATGRVRRARAGQPGGERRAPTPVALSQGAFRCSGGSGRGRRDRRSPPDLPHAAGDLEDDPARDHRAPRRAGP